MAASDTAVGIIGSVVLVAVMVGVFVYEYNNAPEVDDGDIDGGTSMEKNPGDSASGALGPGNNQFSLEMVPDEGVSSITVSVDWSASAALPVGPAGQYNYVLTDATGAELASGTTASNWEHTLAGDDASAQVYTLTLTLPQGGAGGSFDVEAVFDYASTDAEA